jgi:hypothetical protein
MFVNYGRYKIMASYGHHDYTLYFDFERPGDPPLIGCSEMNVGSPEYRWIIGQ